MKNERFIVFDTEDDSPDVLAAGKSGFLKRVTQIAAMTSDGKEYYSKGDVPGFLRWLVKMDPVHVWAHNLQYDLGNLFADCLDEIDATTIGGRFIRATWNGIEFRDSFNLWVCKVADLGEAFGLKKLKTDIHSRKYVMRDVEIVMRALKFIRHMMHEYDIAKFPCTLGGFAVRIWKSENIGGSNWQNDWPFCRSALYGGRVELFRQKARGNLYWTDINSLYPFCMTKDFPDTVEDMKGVDGFGIAGVRIKVPEGFIMPLPVRDANEERIIYPFGTFEGIWTHHEIRNAVEHHGAKILKVYDSIGSKTASPYYADYVKHFYKLRKATDDGAKKLFYKLLMNNLYGQLATRGMITKTVDCHDKRLLSGATVFGKRAFLDLATGVPAHVNYLHAAYVTGYGRLELGRYLRTLGDRMIYCDTDSTIFEGKPPFETGPELGQMKLEARGKQCICYAPKTYVFDDEFVAKGIPKKHAETFIKKRKVSFAQPFRFREAAAFFNRGNKRKLSVWRNITKQLRSEYLKKRFDAKSGRFLPRKFDNI